MQWIAAHLFWVIQHIRLSSPSNTANLVLCVIQDGMDQGKFRVPRVRPPLRQSKLFQKLWRPQLHCSASWVHGHAVNVAIADENLRKDSSCSLEQLVRSLDDVLLQKKCLPPGINLQQDNTYREGKNQYVTAFACLTVCLGALRHCTCSYLRVGHSSLGLAYHLNFCCFLLGVNMFERFLSCPLL